MLHTTGSLFFFSVMKRNSGFQREPTTSALPVLHQLIHTEFISSRERNRMINETNSNIWEPFPIALCYNVLPDCSYKTRGTYWYQLTGPCYQLWTNNNIDHEPIRSWERKWITTLKCSKNNLFGNRFTGIFRRGINVLIP